MTRFTTKYGLFLRVETTTLRDGSKHLQYFHGKICIERIVELTGWYAVGQPDSHRWQAGRHEICKVYATGETMRDCIKSYLKVKL